MEAVLGVVVGLVAEHLAEVVMEEAEKLGRLRHEVEEFARSLRSIRAFVEDANAGRLGNDERLKEWKRQVIDVSYNIENVVDEFLRRVAPKRHRRSALAGYLYRSVRFIRELRARRQIGKEIKRIMAQLHEIDARRKMFSSSADEGGPSSAVPCYSTANASYDNRRLSDPQKMEDSDVVGIWRPKEELVEKLLSEDPGLVIISVVGMGGLGKTTLVSRVYQSEPVERRFKCSSWVTVSKAFSTDDILKQLYKSFMKGRSGIFMGLFQERHSEEEIECMGHLELVNGLQNFMKKKRYLVVLDDLWTIESWEDLKIVFPKNLLSSRIIITTRQQHVSIYCSGLEQNIHHMAPLDETHARTLFYKKAMVGSNSCPPDLVAPSEKFIQKCRGLPLAIHTLGGLLSTKPRCLGEWNRVLDNLATYLGESEVANFMKHVIILSYDDLPQNLKCCFLYYGSYPEDFHIEVSALTQQWMAEGFITATGKETGEEVAERYLKQLIDRNLVEVVDYNYDGSIGHCRVHDVIQLVILEKAEELNFVKSVITEDQLSPLQNVHRLSITSGGIAPRGIDNFTRLRSLTIFAAKEAPPLSAFRMLRVLNLSRAELHEFPPEIVRLYYLIYLNLSETQIKKIPKTIKKLGRLQTLLLQNTNVEELPNEILRLHGIRHLQVCSTCAWEDGVKMPARLGAFKHLHELWMLQMDVNIKQAEELRKLTEMRSIFICQVQRKNWDAICDSIWYMSKLKHLHLTTKSGEQQAYDLNFMSKLSPTLLSILFSGKLTAMPALTGAFLSLVHIELKDSGLSEDPLEALQILPALRELTFLNAFHGPEMLCGEDGYQGLQKFVIADFEVLKSVRITKGAMPNLSVMHIKCCIDLGGLPIGFENLRTMKELTFFNMPKDFILKVKTEDQQKMAHVLRVRHFVDDAEKTEVEYLPS